MIYTYEITTDNQVNIFNDGVQVGYQPQNPDGPTGSRPFANVNEATEWALTDIEAREAADAASVNLPEIPPM